MHPHPQCLDMLINSTLQSGTGMWVGWLICNTVSKFVYVIIASSMYTIMFYVLTLSALNMIFCYIIIPMCPLLLLLLCALHPHPHASSSTVFYYAQQFNAPLENWDVSRVTDMQRSEYIRVCDHVHHPCTHLHHNVMYWLSLSLSLSLSTEYDILLCNHTNVVLSSSSSVHSILFLMHPHPQRFMKRQVSIRIHFAAQYG